MLRKHPSGTPRVAVRSYYEGLPSVAGRERRKGGESRLDHGAVTTSHPLPEERSRGEKSPQWSAVGRVRLRRTHAAPRQAWITKVRHAALRSLGLSEEGKQKTTRPPSLISGTMALGFCANRARPARAAQLFEN